MATPTLNGQYTNTFGTTTNPGTTVGSTPVNGPTLGNVPVGTPIGTPVGGFGQNYPVNGQVNVPVNGTTINPFTGTPIFGAPTQGFPVVNPFVNPFINGTVPGFPWGYQPTQNTPWFNTPGYAQPTFFNPTFFNPNAVGPTTGIQSVYPWLNSAGNLGTGFGSGFNGFNGFNGYAPLGVPSFNTVNPLANPYVGSFTNSWFNNPSLVQAWWNATHNTLGTIAQNPGTYPYAGTTPWTSAQNTGTFPWTSPSFWNGNTSWNTPGSVPAINAWNTINPLGVAPVGTPWTNSFSPTFNAWTGLNSWYNSQPTFNTNPLVNTYPFTGTPTNAFNGLPINSYPFNAGINPAWPTNIWGGQFSPIQGIVNNPFLTNPILAQQCGLVGGDCVCPPGSCYGVQNVSPSSTNLFNPFFTNTWSNPFVPTQAFNGVFNTPFVNSTTPASFNPYAFSWFNQGSRFGVPTWQNTGLNSGLNTGVNYGQNYSPISGVGFGQNLGLPFGQNFGLNTGLVNTWPTVAGSVPGTTFNGYVPGLTQGYVPGYNAVLSQFPYQNASLLSTIAGTTNQVPVTFPYATNANNPFVASLIQNPFGVHHNVNGATNAVQNVGPTLVGCCREAA